MTIKESLDRPLSLKDIKEIFPEDEYFYAKEEPMATQKGKRSKKYSWVMLQHINPKYRHPGRCFIFIGRTTLRDLCRHYVRAHIDPINYDDDK
tara:strand:- start:225 stop:503 length:279 start_codon:yes stop_codon:yes gene_type:complete